MGRRNVIWMSAIIVGVFCGVGLCLENPNVGNPVGSGTVPPTAYKPGLVQSPNPVDNTSNLVITGNVANGMHFRGIVPYNSPSSFYAPANTFGRTSRGIESFLRDSAGSQNFGTSSGGLTPYYSPVWTVTTTQPGGGVISATGNLGNSLAGTNLPGPQTGYYRNVNNSQISQRPLSMSRQDLEKLVEADAMKYPPGVGPGSQEQNQFWRDMGVTIERKGDESDTTGKPGEIKGNESSLEAILGANAKKSQSAPDMQQVDNTQKAGQTQGVYEQMKTQLDKPAVSSQISSASGTSAFQSDLMKVDANQAKKSTSGFGITPEEFTKSYKSFVARSNDKFNQHMKAAEDFMKQGRFYRAADAYTLASIYKPEDPLAYAGKSVALFGSGEYLSSSLFLARTLEIFPEYAKVRIDLVALIGDKDTVENRILEARDWMDKSDSGELEFLLSYIYYQMDRMEFARQSIEAAVKKMPNSPAVAAMKKAVDERLAKP